MVGDEGDAVVKAEGGAKVAGAPEFTQVGVAAALLDAVDVIDICTPTHLHHAMVLQAAAARAPRPALARRSSGNK